MKQLSRMIQQDVFIAEDGTEFLTEIECIQYEKKNEYNEKMKDIIKIEDVLFFGTSVMAFLCHSEEEFNLCNNWFIRNHELKGNQCICTGKFIETDYYVILLNNDLSNIKNNLYVYNTVPYAMLAKQWELITKQIPADPYSYDVLKDMITNRKPTNSEKEVQLQNSLFSQFLKDDKVLERYKEYLKVTLEEMGKQEDGDISNEFN